MVTAVVKRTQTIGQSVVAYCLMLAKVITDRQNRKVQTRTVICRRRRRRRLVSSPDPSSENAATSVHFIVCFCFIIVCQEPHAHHTVQYRVHILFLDIP